MGGVSRENFPDALVGGAAIGRAAWKFLLA